MLKTHVYIVQIVGILLLLCGYFLSDQPDSLSVMHFDSDPSSPSVFSKAIKNSSNTDVLQTSVSSDGSTRHKSKVPKHITFEIALPHKSGYILPALKPFIYTCAIPGRYSYLFYEEINPPPPKSC